MIGEAIKKFAPTLDRTMPDRSRTVGASEVGLCARRVHWTKKNARHDEGYVDRWGARLRGSTIEQQLWHPALVAAYGKRLVLSQQNIVNGVLSCTPDGLVTKLKRDALKHLGVKDILSDCVVVECKSIDPRANLTKEKAENAFQVQVQIGIIREKTKYKPMYAVISYVDASFWDDVDEYVVRFDPKIYEAAKARAKRILTASSPSELQPEGWIAGGGECEYCPYTNPCGVIRRSVPENEAIADPQFAAEVVDMCREIQAMEDALEADDVRLRAAQQALKDRLREKGVRKIPEVVTWSTVKGRHSWDNKGIREAAAKKGIKVEDYSTEGDPSDRLQITLKRTPAI